MAKAEATVAELVSKIERGELRLPETVRGARRLPVLSAHAEKP